MSLGRRGLVWGALALLGACAGPVPRTMPELEGRLTIQVDAYDGAPAHSLSTGFVVRGDARSGSLELTTPLGTTAAKARWDPGAVELTTGAGTRRFADLDAVALELLGEPLPLAAVLDWLQGRPWPGAPSLGTADGFAQLGWQVDLARFGQGWLQAKRTRAPAMALRARLERAQ